MSLLPCHRGCHGRTAGGCSAAGRTTGSEASERAGDKMGYGILSGVLGTLEWLLGDTRGCGGETQGGGPDPGPDRSPLGHAHEPGGSGLGGGRPPDSWNERRCCWAPSAALAPRARDRRCSRTCRPTTTRARRRSVPAWTKPATAAVGSGAMRSAAEQVVAAALEDALPVRCAPCGSGRRPRRRATS